MFVASEGRLRSIHQQAYPVPNAVRLSDDFSMDYEQIYRSQGEVRVVVDFLGRNIGQLALQTFQRKGDNDRRRLKDHPLSKLLDKPNFWTTGSRLIRETVQDKAIFDRALWVKTLVKGEWSLLRVPAPLWKLEDGNWLAPESFTIHGSLGDFTIPREQCVYFRGYNPTDARVGCSPIESLRRALSEAYAASMMREGVLRNGARHSGYLKRPANTPWSPGARDTFKAGWRSQYQGWSATEGGGTPILEDGMEFVPASQTAEQLQYIEARKLTREEAAAAYFIPPPMIGILDHATFSNITEQHKMLYQDTLGPWLNEFQDEIDLQIIEIDFPGDKLYVEFNMMEKLRGSFEEQAKALQGAIGGPYMTPDEGRSRLNLSPIEGGDKLYKPPNTAGTPDGEADPEIEPEAVPGEPPAIEAAVSS